METNHAKGEQVGQVWQAGKGRERGTKAMGIPLFLFPFSAIPLGVKYRQVKSVGGWQYLASNTGWQKIGSDILSFL